MHVIRLSQRLMALPELEALNKHLHNGEVTLDWSDVETGIQPEQLATLFAGFHLSEHIDLIGAATIPQAIMPAIIAAFEAVEAQAVEVTEAVDIADTTTDHRPQGT